MATGKSTSKKVSPTGADLWNATIQGAEGGFSSLGITVDGGGSIYVEYTDYGTNEIFLRKIRGSDRANLGTFQMPGTLFLFQRNSRHVVDSTNNVYWVTTMEDTAIGQIYLSIANINSASPPASTVRTLRLPEDVRLLEVKPRPGGGVLILAGLPVVGTNDEVAISTLYSFAPTGPPKQMFAGEATTFAFVPGTSDIVFAGGRQRLVGAIHLHRAELEGISGIARSQNLGTGPAYTRDLHVTKSGIGVAVGGFDEDTGNYADSLILTFHNQTLANGGNLKFRTLNHYQVMTSVKGDGFDNVTCVENSGNDSFKVIEFDAHSGFAVHTRSFAGSPSGGDAVHSVNSAGFIGVGQANRIVGLKPRDLKDIYMGNTTYTGGANATAIIRMYEPYTYDRNVILSDGGSPYVTIAASKNFAPGQTQVSATVLTTPVPSAQNITLTAKYGSLTRTFAFTLTP